VPRLTARNAYVGKLNDTLLAVNADAPVPIASVSKLITAWVILSAELQLFSFDFGDSSGLSAFNKPSARDPDVPLVMLAQSPWFRNLARKPALGGKMNVNRFAHDRSVSLLAGKTGFTAAAGYCLAMAEEFAGQVFALVVLNARDREERAQDMNALRQFTRQSLAAGPGEKIGR
jgi:D-alanyl-D-alanine endopeptidase (penicillin-binding protein 7)